MSSNDPAAQELLGEVRRLLDARQFDRAVAIARPLVASLRNYGRLGDLAGLSRLLVERLPGGHAATYLFLAAEGDALAALGRASEALERYRRVCGDLEERLVREPGLADLERDLAVSYSRQAELALAEGRIDLARECCEKDFAIVEAGSASPAPGTLPARPCHELRRAGRPGRGRGSPQPGP